MLSYIYNAYNQGHHRAVESTPPVSLSGNFFSIQERNEGTSSAILLGKDELVTNRGILPGCQLPDAKSRHTTSITTRSHPPVDLVTTFRL